MTDVHILTIGHSNHALERFVTLVEGAGVSTIADVRSKPVSRFVPHFNRPDNPSLLRNGKPDYAAMARTPAFEAGLASVIEESAKRKVALLCAERDPLDCHRFRLIGRELAARQIPVAHILSTGEIEPQADTERRAGSAPDDLFGQQPA
jgi:uncharacterized protein (DUF488 family)